MQSSPVIVYGYRMLVVQHYFTHDSPPGLQVDADRFFIFLLLLILVNMAALSVAFCISALTGNFTVANAMITAVFVVSIVSTVA